MTYYSSENDITEDGKIIEGGSLDLRSWTIERVDGTSEHGKGFPMPPLYDGDKFNAVWVDKGLSRK